MVIKFITFSPNNHPPHLHFRQRNWITGWTISKISKSFHHALVALGIRPSAAFAPPPHPTVQGLSFIFSLFLRSRLIETSFDYRVNKSVPPNQVLLIELRHVTKAFKLQGKVVYQFALNTVPS